MLLFLNRRGRPLKRSYVVKFGLKPILKSLGMKTERVGLYAFRHGLGTALCERKANPATVQKILRHSDIRTTLKYYVHSDLDAQPQAQTSSELAPMSTICVLVQKTAVSS